MLFAINYFCDSDLVNAQMLIFVSAECLRANGFPKVINWAVTLLELVVFG